MFIFTHLPSHLWILYGLLFNGFWVSQIASLYSKDFRILIRPFEAKILASFFGSLVINGSSLFFLDGIGCDFTNMMYILPSYSVILMLWYGLKKSQKKYETSFVFSKDGWIRLLLYVLVFTILFYNGGLIERISDSWWHLSFANKIALSNSFDNAAHLNGGFARYYPPLWHCNLAMLNKLSNISLPILWNSFTAWGACFKVMGFYLLALGLCKDKAIAILSAILFVVLPGVGDSYLRVSAWPSHISYIALFCLFYVTFRIFDNCRPFVCSSDQLQVIRPSQRVLIALKGNCAHLVNFVILAIVVIFSHQVELLWFACGILFYAIALIVHRAFLCLDKEYVEPAIWFLRIYLLIGLLGITCVTFIRYYPLLVGAQQITDIHLIFFLVLMVTVSLSYAILGESCLGLVFNEKLAKCIFLLVIVLVVLSIDVRQFRSLFNPEFNYPMPTPHDAPLHCIGWLEGTLNLPGWHRQLRGGLIYSGFLAMGISLFMALRIPTRCTIFLAANAIITFLFFVSPYFFQGISDVLQYNSPSRIALLIFHPIIFAVFIRYLWGIIIGKRFVGVCNA